MKYPAIPPPYEAFYIEAMLRHTNSALDSAEIVSDWIQLIVDDNRKALELPKYKLFEHLQIIIQEAAALSRYLWPVRSGKQQVHERRGKEIRLSLDIAEDNALKDRNLRNHIEHFDEKLDEYLLRGSAGEIIPQDVRAEIPISEVPLHIFKGFYINQRVFILLGKQYEILPLVSAIEEIHEKLSMFMNNGCRFENTKT